MTVHNFSDSQFSQIGAICWFTITGAQVSPAQLEQWFGDLGISKDHLPPAIQPVNAFRKATGPDVKFEYDAPWLGDGKKMKILLRDVSHNKETIERQITREEVDANGKKLSYDKVGQVVFYKAGHQVKITLLPDQLHPDEAKKLSEFTASIEAEHTLLCNYFTSDPVRAMVRNYTLSLNAITVKQSVYFAHQDRLAEVEKMEQLIARIPGNSVYHSLPLIDDLKQRSMLTDAFETQVEAEIQDLLEQIKEINTRTEVKPREYERVLTAYTSAMARSEEHTNKLGLSQERAAVALEMAMDAVMDLGNRVSPVKSSQKEKVNA